MVQHAAINHGTISASVVVQDDGSTVGTASVLNFTQGTVAYSGGTATVDLTSGFAGVRAYATATQSIGTGAYTSLTFDSERFDTHSFHAAGSATFVIPSGMDGYYVMGGCAGFAANGTGIRLARILLNGATRIAESATIDGNASFDVRVELTTAYQLAATNYVEFQLFQNSGGNLNSQVLANSTPEFWMVKVG